MIGKRDCLEDIIVSLASKTAQMTASYESFPQRVIVTFWPSPPEEIAFLAGANRARNQAWTLTLSATQGVTPGGLLHAAAIERRAPDDCEQHDLISLGRISPAIRSRQPLHKTLVLVFHVRTRIVRADWVMVSTSEVWQEGDFTALKMQCL